MNVLFLTIGRFNSIEMHGIYPDLLRQFRDQGHSVYIVSKREKRENLPTECLDRDRVKLLQVCTGNITKCGMLEKGISTLAIEGQYKKAIRKYFGDVTFDLVLYSTPPITLAGVVEYIKKRDHAKTYLLLKDIFPQNAVDIGLMTKQGIKGLLYKMFRKKEKKLYAISDYIGCMSPANVAYLRKHNPEIEPGRVEVCPNSIEPMDLSLNPKERSAMRKKYGIPLDKKVLVYGGNLGKPQGIPFLIECLRGQKDNRDAYFLVVGDGTEYGKLQDFVEREKPKNVKLMSRLPKEDYDAMVAACDVGMIFLDARFTIPNFPSRLLAYMQAKLPVLAVTDENSDVGQVIQEGGFGWWSKSGDFDSFAHLVGRLDSCDLPALGQNAWDYLNRHYHVKEGYKTIMRHL